MATTCLFQQCQRVVCSVETAMVVMYKAWEMVCASVNSKQTTAPVWGGVTRVMCSWPAQRMCKVRPGVERWGMERLGRYGILTRYPERSDSLNPKGLLRGASWFQYYSPCSWMPRLLRTKLVVARVTLFSNINPSIYACSPTTIATEKPIHTNRFMPRAVAVLLKGLSNHISSINNGQISC